MDLNNFIVSSSVMILIFIRYLAVNAEQQSDQIQKNGNVPANASEISSSKPQHAVDNFNCTTNATNCQSDGVGMHSLTSLENKGMLMRTVYVIVGITLIIVLYFGVKTLRTRRKKSKAKKYGVLSRHDLEMTPLDEDDDDDEDMTVFEVNGRS